MTQQDTRRAYTLVSRLYPDIGEDAWIKHIEYVFTRATASKRSSGAIALLTPSEYVFGIFTYGVWNTLALGRCLMVDDFCAAEVPGDSSPSSELLDAAEHLAERTGCEAVCVKFLDGTREHRAWSTHAVAGSAYFELPAVAKRIG